MPQICVGESLPPVSFNFCDPDAVLSEIGRVFVGLANSAPFDDWTAADEWNTRCSQTSTTGEDYIRVFTCIGDKPLPADTEKSLSNNRLVITERDHTINVTVDDVSPENYAFMQAMKGGKQVVLHYETMGGKMFGGNAGILCRLVGGAVLARGVGELMVIQYTFKWKDLDVEDMTDSPIFDQVPGGDSGDGGDGGGGTPTFDTTIVFATDDAPTHGSNTFTAGATNATQKFEYNDIDPVSGTPKSMEIKVGGVDELVVDFTSDFLGAQFRYTDKANVTHLHNWFDGVVNF